MLWVKFLLFRFTKIMKHFFSRIIFLCFFSFAFYYASAFSFSSKDTLQGIVFIEQDWNKALQQAKEEKQAGVPRYLCYLVWTLQIA